MVCDHKIVHHLHKRFYQRYFRFYSQVRDEQHKFLDHIIKMYGERKELIKEVERTYFGLDYIK